MTPAIMKIGTMGSGAYWIRGNKPLKYHRVGDQIKFKPQLLHGAKWETGRITGFSIEMLWVERI